MSTIQTRSPKSRPITEELASLLERIARRALAYCTHMIWEANHRDDVQPGDPKVGGHPASCTSSLHLITALHMVERYPSDYYCAKPHLAPMDHCLHYMLGFMRQPDGHWMDLKSMERTMHRLRQFSPDGKPVFQSYHSELDPDSWRILPSGTVGIPPVCSSYLALAYDYAKDHGFEIKGRKHFWSLIGDSEFREGSLMEALPDIAERELGNITWIIDYNRQNLDGTRIPNQRTLQGNDADRIERTAQANGWEVIQVRHGRKREALFDRPGGDLFRNMLEHELSDYEFQALLFKRDAELLRAALLERNPDIGKFLGSVSDEELLEGYQDLGGHDLVKILEAYRQAKSNVRVPSMIVAHTIKGWGLEAYAAPGNHSSLPDRTEVEAILTSECLTMDDPYSLLGCWEEKGPERRFLVERGAELRLGVDGSLQRREANRRLVEDSLAHHLPLPTDFGLNVDMVPLAHTQWAWGQIAGKLVRVGIREEMKKAGLDGGRELTEEEQKWAKVAELVLTMSPDVGTSTNINPAMNEKVYGPKAHDNLEAEYDFRERGRPELHAHAAPWTRHIRFEIAEANCMSAVGSFGCMGKFTGVPLLPMMTVYDFFIKRALDQLYYNLYWRSSFILVGTPSGVTLSPEGAQHSWKSDIQIPSLITWEPVFAKEMEWIIADAIRRHIESDNEDREGVLIRAVTRGVRQKGFIEKLRAQRRFQDPQGQPFSDEEILEKVRLEVLAGGYRAVDYRGEEDYNRGENVVTIMAMGAPTNEAIRASEQLREVGIYADVIVVTSADLLLGRFARRNDYHHLKQVLGLDGDLHLAPSGDGVLDPGEATLLAARQVPIVSVADGEEGLLDNAGSILGVRQEALAVRKFSKSGRPSDIYDYQNIGTRAIFEAAGKILAETARAEVRLSRSAWQALAARMQGEGQPLPSWQELFPYQGPSTEPD
ncbi:MAG: pyruvate dehydrogenase [Planctomycetota bacterium]|nr:MAG: pyruvate dehydrogenase [Planctomycetota bacterium]